MVYPSSMSEYLRKLRTLEATSCNDSEALRIHKVRLQIYESIKIGTDFDLILPL